MSKLEELLDLIKEDPNFKYYQELESKVNSSTEVIKKVEKIKHLQKEMVLVKEVQKLEKLKKLEEKYNQMLLEIEAIPGLLDYLELQVYYNNLIQDIKNLLEIEVEMIITNQPKNDK